MIYIESNKLVVSQYVAAFNHGDWKGLRALFTDDAVIHGVLGSGGMDKAMPIWKELHAAFGIELTVEEIIAEGDFVAARYKERGTFRAEFQRQPPTGKSYELVAMEWFEFRDSKIRRRWGARDSASQARQMGIEEL
jgi:steroid delta-isomerase-like uncharacterized protein